MVSRLKRVRSAILGLLFAFFALVSCTTSLPSSGIAPATSSASWELTEEFRKGSARLECETPLCAGTFGYNLRKNRVLYDAETWQDLAINVLRIGFGNDLAYYYLGRAAEGLGSFSAADTYYRLSIALAKTGPRCAGLFNNCDGFIFPQDAESRLSIVTAKKVDAQRQLTSPSVQAQPPTQQTSPNTPAVLEAPAQPVPEAIAIETKGLQQGFVELPKKSPTAEVKPSRFPGETKQPSTKSSETLTLPSPEKEPPAKFVQEPETDFTQVQKQGCQKILKDAERLMERVETVRGGIPYKYYVDGFWWRSKTLTEKEALITAISKCKAVIYREHVIHIYDSRSGEELGRTGITGPAVYK